MGLNTHEQQTFLNLKNGKIYLSSDKQYEKPFNSIEGTITEFAFREEKLSDGIAFEKLYITITDEENYKLGVKVESKLFSSIISFLKNADLTKPVSFVALPGAAIKSSTDGGVTTDLLVKQDGNWLKSFYSKASGNLLPQWKEVKIGNKVMQDKSDYEAELKRVIAEDLLPQIKNNITSSVPQTQPEPANTSDDLPF